MTVISSNVVLHHSFHFGTREPTTTKKSNKKNELKLPFHTGNPNQKHLKLFHFLFSPSKKNTRKKNYKIVKLKKPIN